MASTPGEKKCSNPWQLFSHNIVLIGDKGKHPNLAQTSPVLGLPPDIIEKDDEKNKSKEKQAKPKKSNEVLEEEKKHFELRVSQEASLRRTISIPTYSSAPVLSVLVKLDKRKRKRSSKNRDLPASSSTESHSGEKQFAYAIDQALYVGGMPWHLDFCPLDSAIAEDDYNTRRSSRTSRTAMRSMSFDADYLAVAVHPRGFERNRVGQQLNGPGEIQIWELPRKGALIRRNMGIREESSRPTAERGEETQDLSSSGSHMGLMPVNMDEGTGDDEDDMGHLARCALRIAHDGLVAWDVKWSLDPAALDPHFFNHNPPHATSNPFNAQRMSADADAADPPSATLPIARSFPSTEPAEHSKDAQKYTSSSPPSIRLPLIGVLSVVSGNGDVLVLPIPRPNAPEFLATLESQGKEQRAGEGAKEKRTTAAGSAGGLKGAEEVGSINERAADQETGEGAAFSFLPDTRQDGGAKGGEKTTAGSPLFPPPFVGGETTQCTDLSSAPASDDDGNKTKKVGHNSSNVGQESGSRKSPRPDPKTPPLIRIVGAGLALRVLRNGSSSSSSASASTAADGAGDTSLPSCCGWQVAGQRDKLVVGCWDGTIACFKLPTPLVPPPLALSFRPAASLSSSTSASSLPASTSFSGHFSRCDALFHTRPEKMPVRAVAFMPPTGADMQVNRSDDAADDGDEGASGGDGGFRRVRNNDLCFVASDASRSSKVQVTTTGDDRHKKASGFGSVPMVLRRDCSQVRIYIDDAAAADPAKNGGVKGPRAAPEGTSSLAGPAGSIFLSTGQSGTLRIWDTRDMTYPLLEKVLHRSCLSDACWTMASPGGVLLAAEDGALRHVVLDVEQLAFSDEGGVSIFREPAAANISLTSVAAADSAHLLLYGGVSGVMVAAQSENIFDCRNRKPHVPVAGMMRDPGDGALRLLGSDEIRALDCVYAGGSFWRARVDARMKSAGWNADGEAGGCGGFGGAYYDPDANVMHVRVGGRPGGGALWAAAAHRCGVIRCVRLKNVVGT